MLFLCSTSDITTPALRTGWVNVRNYVTSRPNACLRRSLAYLYRNRSSGNVRSLAMISARQALRVTSAPVRTEFAESAPTSIL